MKKIVSVILCLITVLTLFMNVPFTVNAASSGIIGDCTWTLDDSGNLIVSGKGIMQMSGASHPGDWTSKVKNVTIEEGVTSIGNFVFSGCYNLKSVSIPNSVTSIGNGAFFDCSYLSSINIPNSVISIGNEAFSGCKHNLTSVIIPDSVTSIGYRAFYNCSHIQTMIIPDSVTHIGYDAFGGSSNPWISSWSEGVIYLGKVAHRHYGQVIPENITIKKGIVEISGKAFYCRRELVSISIPNSVTEIGELAFGTCTNLNSITIPNSVTKINNSTFKWCVNLSSITIPKSVTSIGNNAFEDCESLTDIYYTGSQDEWETIKIYKGNDYLKNATIHFNSPQSDVNIPDTDTDGDGLLDEWEINGFDYDGDGTIDVDLPLMGADPNKPDIYVEVDWMVRPQRSFLWYETQKSRSMAPSSNAMRLVYNSFMNHGINLHIDVGPDSIDYVTGKKWGSLSGGNEIPYEKMFNIQSSWDYTVKSNFSNSRYSIFKHCLFVDQFKGTTSGIANDIPGQFFIVANQDWVFNGGDISVGGTFMHELGHTLGLCHGGCDHEHYKPNYLSIMNYAFQTTGLVGTGAVNYSDYKLPDLDEAHINENLGIDPSGLTNNTGLGTTVFYRDKKQSEVRPISRTAIDFNNNGTLESDISIDLNPNGNVQDSPIAILQGHQDWDGIVFNGGSIGKLNVYSSGLAFSINDMGLDEKTLEDSLSTSTLANDNTGYIELLPSTLIAGLDGQYIDFEIGNLSANESLFEVCIVCDDLFDPFTESVVILGSEDEIENNHIKVPVTKQVLEGQYSINCTVSSFETITNYVFDIDAITVSHQEVYEMEQQITDENTLDNSQTDRINELITLYSETIKAFITGHSISLNGDIGINYYVDIPDEEVNTGKVKVDFTWIVDSEEKTYSVTLNPEDKTEYGYKASCPIAVAEMTYDVTAVVTIDGVALSIPDSYSAQRYAKVILNNENNFRETYIAAENQKGRNGEQRYNDLVTLVQTMLDYGTKAQVVFNRDTEHPANEGTDYFDDETNPVSANMITITEENMDMDLSAYGLRYKGSTVVYLSETSIRHYYYVDDWDSFNMIKDSITFDGVAVTYTEKDDAIYFEKKGVSASNLDTPYTLTIKDKSCKFAVNDYIRHCLESTKVSDNTKALVKATYRYNIAANAFFEV